MISAPDRQEAMMLIEQAVQAGARQALACRELGVSARTLQRWQHQAVDGRPEAQRPAPPSLRLTIGLLTGSDNDISAVAHQLAAAAGFSRSRSGQR